MVTRAPGCSRPSIILFAAECPANEKAFAFSLAQAKESGASLVILHVCDETAQIPSGTGDGQNLPRAGKDLFEAMVQHAGELGIQCRLELRKGATTEEILRFLKERRVDRVVMGVHAPGPTGKLLVGSVAETILRNADVPVALVGPYLRPGTYRDLLTRIILCSVSSHPSSETAAQFAAGLALRHRAQLVLQYAVLPQEAEEVLASQPLNRMEQEMLDLIPAKVRAKLNLRTTAVLGDPAEELLYLGRVLQANLIVIGVHNNHAFRCTIDFGPSLQGACLCSVPCPYAVARIFWRITALDRKSLGPRRSMIYPE